MRIGQEYRKWWMQPETLGAYGLEYLSSKKAVPNQERPLNFALEWRYGPWIVAETSELMMMKLCVEVYVSGTEALT